MASNSSEPGDPRRVIEWLTAIVIESSLFGVLDRFPVKLSAITATASKLLQDRDGISQAGSDSFGIGVADPGGRKP
jgi:hypothetical protein